ncbi:hypothetical protein QR680_013574 [Steinernema hermaphroditum]|uniref:ZP domain-containing protein n=1 Tax=Steinernema hermaphroditum TaxID=289476 RepID=A0AA39I835_9BILA|nr:hypothetical protein QR680_013574 [Steinernema hermaphroditum]
MIVFLLSLSATVILGDEFSELVKAEVPVHLEPLTVFADRDFWNVTSTPNCTLSLHRTTCSSPPLGYYDTISWSTRICFKWRCNHDDYAMRVEKCWTGSRKNPVYLIGHDGCTAERSILRTPSYDAGLQTATSLGWLSVRLVGTRFVRFGCDLRLCNKCDPNCSSITPPQKCPDYVPYHANKAILHAWNATVIPDDVCVEETDESSLLEELSTEPPCLNGAWRASASLLLSVLFLLTSRSGIGETRVATAPCRPLRHPPLLLGVQRYSNLATTRYPGYHPYFAAYQPPPIDPIPITDIFCHWNFRQEVHSDARRRLIWFIAKSLIPNINFEVIHEKFFPELADYCRRFEFEALVGSSSKDSYLMTLTSKIHRVESDLVSELTYGDVEEPDDPDEQFMSPEDSPTSERSAEPSPPIDSSPDGTFIQVDFYFDSPPNIPKQSESQSTGPIHISAALLESLLPPLPHYEPELLRFEPQPPPVAPRSTHQRRPPPPPQPEVEDIGSLFSKVLTRAVHEVPELNSEKLPSFTPVVVKKAISTDSRIQKCFPSAYHSLLSPQIHLWFRQFGRLSPTFAF